MKILDSNDDWNEFIEKFPHLDIYYSKHYVNLFANIEEGMPKAVYFENENGKLFYPFILRKIAMKEGYFDIITPYGYGGPVIEGNNVIEKFYEQFKNFCINNNIISETIRLHPLLKNDVYMKDIMKVDYIRKTTAVDLTLSLDTIRKNYTTNNKRNIRKSIKEGVKVSVSNNKENIDIFLDLYYETMDRNNASKFYYFNKSYFYHQMEDTALSRPYLLFAKHDNQIVGGVLLIIGKEFAHYHLGASKTEYLHLKPNNLLFDAMVEFSKSLGLKSLHLGGGHEEKDSLYKFKTSFTNNKSYNYYIGKNIINDQIYKELSNITMENLSLNKEGNYFPIYRRKN
jgi:hypothetical protein